VERKEFYMPKLKKNPKISKYYKKYCKILTKVMINLAKKMTYEKQIRNSKNKARTTWNLINREVCKKVMNENIQTLNIEGKNAQI
jgi:hypothetical protein